MSKKYPNIVLCKDCKHSKPSVIPYEKDKLYCHHPVINANDAELLSSPTEGIGTPCKTVRDNHQWFSHCGMKGKLFEKIEKPKKEK